ncbi:hypothetical protein GCM10009790_15800 [Georgenia ruanii]
MSLETPLAAPGADYLERDSGEGGAMAVSERWKVLIGPFYTSVDLEWWLGLSERRIRRRVRAGELLAVRDRSGEAHFPVWQFRPDGQVIEGLPDVWRALGERSGVERARWLRRSRPDLGGRCPVEALLHARPADVRAIVELAEADEITWAT